MRHTENRVGLQGFQRYFQHQLRAVGCFDKKLGLVVLPDELLQAPQVAGQFGTLGREVAVKRKPLPVHTRGHERQQQRRRPHEGHHPNALPVRQRHDSGARIGHARAARVRQRPHIPGGPQGLRGQPCW